MTIAPHHTNGNEPTQAHDTPLAAALRDFERGWLSIPIAVGQKGPTTRGWQHLRPTRADIATWFEQPRNRGVLLGAPSGDLVDVDLDSPEAVALAPYVLPRTGCVFGRPGKPRSHWLYHCPGAESLRATEQRRTAHDDGKAETIAELRSTGQQTVFPGSTHPSGERIEWHACDELPTVGPATLRGHVVRLALLCMLHRRGVAVEPLFGASREVLLANPALDDFDRGEIARWSDPARPRAPRARRDEGPPPVDAFPIAVRDFGEWYRVAHGDFPSSGGSCPICGHNGCFGSLPDAPHRWACFSSAHPAIGKQGNGCYHGDAIDIVLAWSNMCRTPDHRDDQDPTVLAMLEAWRPGLHAAMAHDAACYEALARGLWEAAIDLERKSATKEEIDRGEKALRSARKSLAGADGDTSRLFAVAAEARPALLARSADTIANDLCAEAGIGDKTVLAHVRDVLLSGNARPDHSALIHDRLRECGREPYSAEELAAFALDAGTTLQHFAHRMVVQAGTSFYVFFDGAYLGPFVERELVPAAKKYLAPTGLSLLKCVGETADGKPKFRDMSAAEIVSAHGVHAKHVQIDLTAQRARYDAATHAIVEAPCPIRRDVEPRHSADVDQWLRQMCGTAYERVLDWLATVTDLRRAAPMLYLSGPKGVGKSLLACGVAAIWNHEGKPTEMESAMSRFNTAILSCPVAFGDERIPSDRGVPRTEDLRAGIAAVTQRVERKYHGETYATGALRYIAAANNGNLLDMRGVELTGDDVKAIADRILAVRIPADCPPLPIGVITPDMIAAHALWLRTTRAVAADPRWACRSSGAELADDLTVRSGLRAAVMAHVVAAVIEPARQLGVPFAPAGASAEPAVRVDAAGAVWVCATLLHAQRGAFDAFNAAPPVDKLQRAIAPLCDGDPWRPRPLHEASKRGHNYRRVRRALIETWLADSDVPREDFDKAITLAAARAAIHDHACKRAEAEKRPASQIFTSMATAFERALQAEKDIETALRLALQNAAN